MSSVKVSVYEEEYKNAVIEVLEKKKLYLAKALEQEELAHLENLGLDGWSEEDREEAYRQEVLPYWNRFGISPKQFWFELYGSRDYRMDPRFLPADFYFNEILPYINNGQQSTGLSNKGYLEYLFSDVRQPRTVILRIEGNYCDSKRNIITEDEAIGYCLECDTDLFVKVSYDTSGGEGISVFTPSDCDKEDIRNIFNKAGSSFIVQERVRQHPLLDGINSHSVTTVRVLSLLMEDKVYIESGALRISSPDTPFMKIYDGGVTTEILEGGKLHPRVFSDYGKWYDDGKGYFDETFILPGIEKIYDEVRRIHPRMGHFKCIGWDFAVGHDGEPILLEFNVFPALGCTQITRCKPIFNERTDWLLEDYFQRRTWEKNHRQDILIQ